MTINLGDTIRDERGREGVVTQHWYGRTGEY